MSNPDTLRMNSVSRISYAAVALALATVGCASSAPAPQPIELCALNSSVGAVLEPAALRLDLDYALGCSPEAVTVGFYEAGDCRPADVEPDAVGLWGDGDVCVSIARRPGQPFPTLEERVAEALAAALP